MNKEDKIYLEVIESGKFRGYCDRNVFFVIVIRVSFED